MINYFYEIDFKIEKEEAYTNWIGQVATSEGKTVGEVNYVFCDDKYLHKINVEFLNHDTYTDIISFDNTLGNQLGGDIFVSIDRVRENAKEFSVDFKEELRRVMIHGVLHLCGYKDKTDSEETLMRQKENEKITLFHVEQ